MLMMIRNFWIRLLRKEITYSRPGTTHDYETYE